MAAAPTQVASLAGVLGSLDMNVPIMGHAPEWTASLLDSPAGPALLENFYLISSAAPYSADVPGTQRAVEGYKAADPDGAESWEVPLAWGEGLLLHTALENA